MSLKRSLNVSAAAMIITGLIAPPAFAQDSETAEVRRLDPVLTTAQRVEESAQDVPISITTVSGEKLDNIKAGGADIRFLSARVPSVIAESSFGRAFPRFYIRGIGNTDFDLNASQPVSLVYDDVPYESPILKGFPVFDLDSIEVLRGPQGTLFGRNTPGGIIKFDSVKPGEETNGYIRGSFGNYNTREFEGAFGARPSDGFAFRASGLVQLRDDFVDNAFTGESDALEGFEEYAGRVQTLFSPSSQTDILINLHARQNDSSARLFRANVLEVGREGLAPGFDFETVFQDGDNFLEQTSSGITARLDHEISDALDFTYVYGYETAKTLSRADIDGGFGAAFLGEGNFGPGFIPFPSETSGGVDKLRQQTHEARFAFDDGGPLRAQAGLFIFSEEVNITSQNIDTLSGGTVLTIAQRSLDTDSTGIFASFEYDLSDRLTVAGGARWTEDEKEFRATGDERELGDEQISWDASATYALQDDVNIYAKVAKGFRGPTVQQRFGAPSQADSETVLSYEAGVKSELFANRIRTNANVYFYEIDGQQLTIVGGIDNSVSLFNADKSEGYGFEADLEAIVTDNLLVTAGLSYNKTEFKDDVIIADGCGGGCTVLDPQAFDANGDPILNAFGGPTFNIAGNSFPNAPEWIANFTAQYSIPVDAGEYYAFTDWAYKGDTNFFLYDSVEFLQEGYWQGGLRAGYRSDSGMDVSGFVRNLTDEIVLEGGIDFNNLTGFVNEPRTYGIELRFDF
jgi:iron complex outermembrane receptor protein